MSKGEVCYLTKDEILSIHQSQLEEFGGDEGAIHPDLIDSIVASPKSHYFGREQYPDLFQKAGKYMFELCNQHIFVDGNKRTAAVVAITFLEKNGYIFIEDYEGQLHEFTENVASSSTNPEDPETGIEAIADWFAERVKPL